MVHVLVVWYIVHAIVALALPWELSYKILVRPWPEWPERLPRPCKIDGGTYHCLHLLLLCGILHNTQEDEIPGKVLLERIEKVSLLLGRSHQSYPAELQLMKFFHYVGTNIGKIVRIYTCIAVGGNYILLMHGLFV